MWCNADVAHEAIGRLEAVYGRQATSSKDVAAGADCKHNFTPGITSGPRYVRGLPT